jgi:protein-disulfide isomerase
VLERNAGNVKIVFKNMPLRSHQFAEPAARAAMAANEQGKFWEFYHELFTTQKLSGPAIEAIAVKLQLDMVRFKQDMASPKIQQKIMTDMKDAGEVGVTGTPAIFINGKALRNREPEAIQKIIDDELKNVKSSH